MLGHFIDSFYFRQLLLEIITIPHKLWTSLPTTTHFLDKFSSGGFSVFSRFDARYRRSENLHASGRDARSAQDILQVLKMHLRAR